MKVSQRILLIMEAKGITQKELAQAVGIGQSTISDWRTKGTDPTCRYIPRIANALDVSIETLFKGVQ